MVHKLPAWHHDGNVVTVWNKNLNLDVSVLCRSFVSDGGHHHRHHFLVPNPLCTPHLEANEPAHTIAPTIATQLVTWFSITSTTFFYLFLFARLSCFCRSSIRLTPTLKVNSPVIVAIVPFLHFYCSFSWLYSGCIIGFLHLFKIAKDRFKYKSWSCVWISIATSIPCHSLSPVGLIQIWDQSQSWLLFFCYQKEVLHASLNYSTTFSSPIEWAKESENLRKI